MHTSHTKVVHLRSWLSDGCYLTLYPRCLDLSNYLPGEAPFCWRPGEMDLFLFDTPRLPAYLSIYYLSILLPGEVPLLFWRPGEMDLFLLDPPMLPAAPGTLNR